jgi:NAD(P)-dependent dehydrogenase (short-subunit alcohol dehydrogenase family)
MRCAEKVVVVTGAGSGMGRELVFELLRRKARVAAVDLNAASLQSTAELAAAPSDKLATFTLNVADREGVERLPQAVHKKFGAVDGIINCAGIIQPFVSLADLDFAVIERVFDVNFRGTLFITKAFLPLLLARPSAHVVNVSSMGGFLPFPGQTAYGASKAAVKLMTEGLHAELADTNVRVTVVFPGAVATNIKANSGVTKHSDPPENAKGRAMPADMAARQILDGMEQDRYRVIVGKDAWFLDLLYRFNPARATTFVAKQMKKHASSS